ncbi:MAG: DEAD/DEAH box helicase [Pseudobdellovibrionaceae bacterium]
MKFADLNLEPSLNTSIEKLGFDESTPIQTAVFPHIFEGKDVAGLAQTGTGKTAAFLIPLMDRILKGRVQTQALSDEQKAMLAKRSFQDWRANQFILILVPTRELAEQVHENILKLGEASGLRGAAVYGGTGYDKQKEAFKNQVEFVVATPGRLIDLYKEHVVDLKQVRAIIFDEADRMFDMGFKDDMKYILSRVPRERQFLVFSATLNFDVLNTAYQFGAEPVEVDVSRDQAKAENVKDEIFHVGHEDKPMYLLSLLKKYNPKQAIIFSNFKFNVEKVARFLSENGVHAMGISSLLTQAQRNRVMEQFKADNEKNILVATDVAARGLDIKGVDLVINYELPQDAESYVHRIGRTGRAGAEGRAFSLVSDRDVESLSRIEDYLKHKVDIGWIEETDLIREFKAFPHYDEGGGGREKPFSRDSRGPRPSRGGPRGERGDRRPRRDGDRPGGGPRGPRSEHRGESRQDYRGENRQEGRRNDRPQQSHQSEQQGRRHQPRGEARQSRPHQQGNQRRHQRSENGSQHSQPRRHQQQPRQQKSQQTPPAGLVKKVSGFFKKLWGDKST